MSGIIYFANNGCLTKHTKMIGMAYPITGFPAFRSAFAGTYTVGAGWSRTNYSAGDLVKRVTSTWIDVYEAKTNHTASADPASDTTNWRHAGATRTPGEPNEWYNVSPLVKFFHRGAFLANVWPAGWRMTAFGFEHPPQMPPPYYGGSATCIGCIVRYNGAKYRAKGDLAFSVAPTNTAQWEPYNGQEKHLLDYKFGRYLPLDFTVGDIVVRQGLYSPYIQYYRCKADVDYGESSDGTGDPAINTDHWEEYKGDRSLWIDFARGITPYQAPFNNHRMPRPWYKKWKETSRVFLNGELQVTKVRVYKMDLRRVVSLESEETSRTENIAMPSFPEGPTNGTDFPPASQPSWGDWYHRTWHYHERMVSNFDIAGFQFPDWGMNVTYSRTTYASCGSQWASTFPPRPWVASSSAASMVLPMTDITLEGGTKIEFTFKKDIEWYHEFDMLLYARAAYNSGRLEWWCEPYFGWNLGDGSGNGNPPSFWPYPIGVNTIHKVPIEVKQTIELLDQNTDWMNEALEAMNTVSFPPNGWQLRSVSHNWDGTLGYTDVPGGSAGFNVNIIPYQNLDSRLDGQDNRLYRDYAVLYKWAAWIMPRHWKIEQEAGGQAIETEYVFDCSVVSHTVNPSITLRRVQIADTDPSP